MTRHRLITILSLVFVLALTTTTALAARPRFSSAIVFTLSTLGGSTAQAALQGFTANLHDESDRPIALVASGQLGDLVDGRKYELVINAKGKAEIVCRSNDDDYHGTSPKTVDVSASGSTTLTASGDQASFAVDVEELKIDTKHACGSGYGNDSTRPRVTILKVLYSSGDVLLLERKSKNSNADQIAALALNGHDKNKPLDRVQFSKCKTKDLNVYCKQKGAD
jgi:hypothetical protein